LLLDVYGACNEARRVYWWQDDPVSAAELWGIESSRMLEGERRLAAGADLVVVANERAVGRWNGVAKSVRYIPYGCDAGGFAATGDLAPPGDVSLPAPVAGFVGHLNRRTDLALLDAVAERGISLLLIGPRDPEFEPEWTEALLARTNVAWIGARPFEELPSYLGLVDVGLVPYAPTDFNQWSFPLKTLEYISAGLPVVATSLPATRSLATDLVTLADEPEAFADAVERVLPSAHDPALVVRRRQFAAVHSWRNRAAEFATALELPQTRS
jgi:glycosyltransferase involved in cell wall biosynthesis